MWCFQTRSLWNTFLLIMRLFQTEEWYLSYRGWYRSLISNSHSSLSLVQYSANLRTRFCQPHHACTVTTHDCSIFLDYNPWLERRQANSATMLCLASDHDNIIIDFPLLNPASQEVLVTVQTLVVFYLFLSDKAHCVQQIIQQIRIAITRFTDNVRNKQ